MATASRSMPLRATSGTRFLSGLAKPRLSLSIGLPGLQLAPLTRYRKRALCSVPMSSRASRRFPKTRSNTSASFSQTPRPTPVGSRPISIRARRFQSPKRIRSNEYSGRPLLKRMALSASRRPPARRFISSLSTNSIAVFRRCVPLRG